MGSFNKVTICGYIGKDAETRFLPDGTAIANFSIATNEVRKDRSGERQESVTWFRVSLIGKVAETLGQYLTKGRQVYVDGKLSQQEFTDRDGNKRTSLEVKASDVQLLGKQEGDGQQPQEKAASASKGFRVGAGGRVESPPIDDGSDIPF